MSEKRLQILWIDDEINLLRSLIRYIEEKGYQVTGVNNGLDAIDLLSTRHFDVVLLDEQMPGRSGLEVLESIKELYSWIPVIMITKSEAEDLMDQAIGAKIEDYLIKPVKPQQLLLSLKKTAEKKKITTEQNLQKYRQDFTKLSMQINEASDLDSWKEIYRRLTYWDLEFEDWEEEGFKEILGEQFREANRAFFRFVQQNYPEWLKGNPGGPVLSHQVLKRWLLPKLDKQQTQCLLVIDNLRYDQWKVLERLISDYYLTEQEELYFSILPTVTQYARNALFAGLTPLGIYRQFPEKWLFDDSEGGKNRFEEDFLRENLKREGYDGKIVFRKIRNQAEGKKVMEELANLSHAGLIVLVYNFVDMLSHARTEMEMIRELTQDARAFRGLTLSWFRNSYLSDTLKWMAANGIPLSLTTDHGSKQVEIPVKVVGDRESTTNIRYKSGKNLTFDESEVFFIPDPEEFRLPKSRLSSRYIIARENQFFVYPKNYNHFVRYFRGSFQHGGISMEEMIVPYVTLAPRS